MSRTRKRVVAVALAAVAIGLSTTTFPLRAELATIELYTRFGSPVVGLIANCRFRPTCSRFALQSLRSEGFLEGNLLIAKRLLSCSPIGAIRDALSTQSSHPVQSAQ